MSDDAGAEGRVSSPQASDTGSVRCDRKLLELLICPVSKGPLDYDAKSGELISRKARLAFPIRDGVPLMTEEAARHLDD